jgi:hypothetical protein
LRCCCRRRSRCGAKNQSDVPVGVMTNAQMFGRGENAKIATTALEN